MAFPQFNAPIRTDLGFRNRDDPLHHKEYSLLENVGSSDGMRRLDMVRDFSTSDPLHLLHQGIMKHCIRMWIDGTNKYKSKFSVDNRNVIDKIIYHCNKSLSSDINRQVRSLQFIANSKATEFRTILLYTGFIVFKTVLPEHIYIHFVRLCIATRIISCQTYTKSSNLKDLARVLLLDYFKDFIKFYGADSIVSNLHYIIHIMDDVDRFGTLDENSTYPFENYLREIKLRTQASQMPLQQITRRIIELSLDPENNLLYSKYSELNEFMPELKYEIKESNRLIKRYRSIRITQNVIISTRKIGDSFFITQNRNIIQMKYAFVRNSSFFICGNEFQNKRDFFEVPFPSNLMDIYLCDQTKEETDTIYEITSIKSKMICIPNENQYLFMPVLHSIDECNSP